MKKCSSLAWTFLKKRIKIEKLFQLKVGESAKFLCYKSTSRVDFQSKRGKHCFSKHLKDKKMICEYI
jgi:hypothetical protein